VDAGGRWWTLRRRQRIRAPPAETTLLAAKQAETQSPLTDSNRRPPPYHGSGTVLACTAEHSRSRFSCKSPLSDVSAVPARDRACTISCTRLVPATCCLFAKHTTANVHATDRHYEPVHVRLAPRHRGFGKSRLARSPCRCDRAPRRKDGRCLAGERAAECWGRCWGNRPLASGSP